MAVICLTDLVGSLQDLVDPDVPQELLDGVVLQVSVPALHSFRYLYLQYSAPLYTLARTVAKLAGQSVVMKSPKVSLM